MLLTNNHKLPVPLFNALTYKGNTPKLKRISATDLIDSPLRRILKIKYFDNISVDASENLWALLGTAIHRVIERSGSKETSELKKEIEYNGATLVTMGDYYENQELIDWKVTSVWSFVLGIKEEWTKQLNVIRFIYNKVGLEVNKLMVYAILRDWQRGKCYEKDYPQIPFQGVNIPLMKNIDQYINERVSLHLAAEKSIANVGDIPQCTEKERWSRPTIYALMKDDMKRAVRVFNNFEEATVFSVKYNDDGKNKGKKTRIETRPGEDTKCLYFCTVSKFCPYMNMKLKEK